MPDNLAFRYLNVVGLLMTNQCLELGQRAGIDYVMFFQPASACPGDAITQVGEISGAVCIRIDADQHPLILGVLALPMWLLVQPDIHRPLRAPTIDKTQMVDCIQA